MHRLLGLLMAAGVAMVVGAVALLARSGTGAVLAGETAIAALALVGLLTIEAAVTVRGFAEPNATDLDV